MARVTRWESLIHAGGTETGPVVGAVITELVSPRWLRFLPAQVYVTVTGLDDVEAWVRGAQTVAQAHAVHATLVARYRTVAHARARAVAASVPVDTVTPETDRDAPPTGGMRPTQAPPGLG